MILKTLLLILFFAITLPLAAQSSMEEGLEFLGEKDYGQAIQTFQNEVKNNPSSEAFYNLGIAYIGKGEALYALWAFESALKYNPSSSKAAHNARVLFTELHPEENWIAPYGLGIRIVTYFSATFWMALAFLFSLGISVLIFFMLAKQKHMHQNTFRALLVVGTLLLVCFVWAYGANKSHYSRDTYAIVKYHNAPIFIGKEGVPAATQFNIGDRLNFIVADEEWTSVSTKEGDVYWIESNQLLRY
jgi:tetratricopeptide (TPR) repeat protein